MKGQTLLAAGLILFGVLALGYGGFSYTKETHQADIGPLHVSVDEKQRVQIPIWLGIGSLVLGAALLLTGRRS